MSLQIRWSENGLIIRMLDTHSSSATNMLYDLELFLSLLTSVLLFILAIPVRNLKLSPDTLFDKSCYYSQHYFTHWSPPVIWHISAWQIYITVHTMQTCIACRWWLAPGKGIVFFLDSSSSGSWFCATQWKGAGRAIWVSDSCQNICFLSFPG